MIGSVPLGLIITQFFGSRVIFIPSEVSESGNSSFNKDMIFFAFSFGPFFGFWLAFEAGEALGALSIPGGGLSSATRLRAIFTHDANVLCCTPTYALRLAEAAKEEGVDLTKSPVRTIVVAGEPGGSIPATRARLKEAWPGVEVFDHHGMTEVGPVTVSYTHLTLPTNREV